MTAPRICPRVWGKDSTMTQEKQASQRKRRNKTLPVLGAAGLSLALASDASAVPSGPVADTPTRDTSHEFNFAEEEISDVTLATFYVFDKENIIGTSEPSVQIGRRGCGGCRGCHARGCGRGCGGHGCRGCSRGCGGCGGCGGWGGCIGIWWGGCGGCGGGGYWCWRNGVRVWCY